MATENVNEQYEVFDYCCSTSGTTQTNDVPHPTYTDKDGNEKVQFNAVKLGGINGLNN